MQMYWYASNHTTDRPITLHEVGSNFLWISLNVHHIEESVD